MTIEPTNVKPLHTVQTMPHGEAFTMDGSPDVFMALANGSFNAVNLRDGHAVILPAGQPVTPVEAKVVVNVP